MKQEHYDSLRERIKTADTEYPSIRAAYENGEISSKRFRWDLTYAGSCTSWICENLYKYLDDTHIDTALRKITGTK